MVGKITFISGIYQGKEYYFKNILTIGRSPANDVQLPFPSVSREHARLSLAVSSGELKDLKSNNGTFLNGRIISDRSTLKNGDIIKISNFEIKFELLDDDSVDSKLLQKKIFEKMSDAEGTATGFIDIQSVNLSDLEKKIRK